MAETQVVHPYVTSSEGVQGGRAVIRGTRIPVTTLVIWYKQGKEVDEILQLYPNLSLAQIYDALSYYHDHQHELETEISQLQDEDYWKTKYPAGKGKSQ